MSDDDEQCESGRGRRKKNHRSYTQDSDDEFNEQMSKPSQRANKKSRVNSATAVSRENFHDENLALNDIDIYEDKDELTEFETGQIMRVFVQDFMCHHKLTIDFGRHVNFVTGANGSGSKEVTIPRLKHGNDMYIEYNEHIFLTNRHQESQQLLQPFNYVSEQLQGILGEEQTWQVLLGKVPTVQLLCE